MHTGMEISVPVSLHPERLFLILDMGMATIDIDMPAD